MYYRVFMNEIVEVQINAQNKFTEKEMRVNAEMH